MFMKEQFEMPTIEVVELQESEVIATGDCCGDGHCGDRFENWICVDCTDSTSIGSNTKSIKNTSFPRGRFLSNLLLGYPSLSQ